MNARGAPVVTGAVDAFVGSLMAHQPTQVEQHWRAQSLASGAVGIALPHIERALSDLGSWRTAHKWVTAAAGTEITAADDAGLYFGAPALSFTLHAAGADGTRRYAEALSDLDTHVTALTHRRVDRALERIGRGDLPDFTEYDLVHGLTGIGAHLLQHCPGDDALERALTYLVRLTEPLCVDGENLPGWWVAHDPQVRQSSAFVGGHANLGIAHGIAGPLALLAKALRRGITIDGHRDAIATICDWLDVWRQDGEPGPWWPQWIVEDERRTGRLTQRGPLRPSWCYGTPGLARAQQIAAIAIGDTTRQRLAEQALATCLSDPTQLARVTDTSLCHGWSGLYQTSWRAARDELEPTISVHLPMLTGLLTGHGCHAIPGAENGLLEGTAGLALALHTAIHGSPPLSRWDACLLID